MAIPTERTNSNRIPIGTRRGESALRRRDRRCVEGASRLHLDNLCRPRHPRAIALRTILCLVRIKQCNAYGSCLTIGQESCRMLLLRCVDFSTSPASINLTAHGHKTSFESLSGPAAYCTNPGRDLRRPQSLAIERNGNQEKHLSGSSPFSSLAPPDHPLGMSVVAFAPIPSMGGMGHAGPNGNSSVVAAAASVQIGRAHV